MPEVKWYYATEGHQFGPLSGHSLDWVYSKGVIEPTTPVLREGDAAWATAADFPGQIPSALYPYGASPAHDGMIACGKCKTRVSDEAVACPSCGQAQERASWKVGDFYADHLGWCEYCRVQNRVTSAEGYFYPGACRGCARPIQEACASMYFERDVDEAYGRVVEACENWGRTFQVGLAALAFVVSWVALSVVTVLIGGAAVSDSLFWALFPALIVACWFWGDERPKIWLTLLLLEWWRLRLMRRPGLWAGKLPIRRGDWRNAWWDVERSSAAGRLWRYPYRRTHKAVTDPPKAARPERASRWLSPWLILPALALGYYVYQSEFTQYAKGKAAGVQHVRQMNMRGAFIRSGVFVANKLDLIVTGPKATPDWNAGFRVGFKEEVERMYPTPK